jgi:hypothetical protein
VLYRERPADLDKAAYNIALAANTAGLHRWSAIKLEEQLTVHLRALHGMAEQERAEGRRLLERHGNGARAVATAVGHIQDAIQAEQESNRTPGVHVSVEVDTATLGSAVTAVTANEGDVTARTTQFEALTKEKLAQLDAQRIEAIPATTTASPVHVPGEELRPPRPLRPPIPADEDADPGASSPLARQVLPRRPRVTVMPVPMPGDEGSDQAVLREVRPAQSELAERDWVLDEAEPGAGVLRLVSRVAIVYDGQSEPVGARVYFAAGGDRRVNAQGTVRAMRAADAEPLVKAREAAMDEMEASL